MLMEADQCVLVIVDIQEKLAPAVADINGIVDVTSCLTDAAGILGVPIVVTEHCADRIGGTVPALQKAVELGTVVPKVHFNAMMEDPCAGHFESLNRRQVIVCGTEAHVCVLQTAHGLKAGGYETFIVADAVGSRKIHDRDTALSRMTAADMTVVTAEMVLFEWLARGDTDTFRQVLPMIKALQSETPAK